MTNKTICRDDGRCEYAIQAGIEGLAQCQAGKCSMPQPAHLTIPGALEWDGDNGTHGVVGTHGTDGESASAITSHSDPAKCDADVFSKGESVCLVDIPKETAENVCRNLSAVTGCKIDWHYIGGRVHIKALAPVSAYTAVDMSTAAAGGFRDGQAELHAVLNQAYMALIGYLPGHRNDLTDAAIAACSAILFPVEAKAACSRCGGWGHIETEDSAHDCPECGPSVIERAVEAGVMNAPSKPKTCIECDQPYCHGVCVERGDQDYDRDQAATGGEQ